MELYWFICLPPSSFPYVPQQSWNSCGLTFYSLIFSGVGSIPPATPVNYVPWAIVGFIFQYVVRRKHFSYWAKYNYVLSAALDAGTAVGLILVYFWSVNYYRSSSKSSQLQFAIPNGGKHWQKYHPAVVGKPGVPTYIGLGSYPAAETSRRI